MTSVAESDHNLVVCPGGCKYGYSHYVRGVDPPVLGNEGPSEDLCYGCRIGKLSKSFKFEYDIVCCVNNCCTIASYLLLLNYCVNRGNVHVLCLCV